MSTGVESGFIRISDSTGIKLFPTKQERDHSFYGQYYGHKKKLAPAVGQRFHLFVPYGERGFDGLNRTKVYGYFTQVAQNVGRRAPTEAFLDKIREAKLNTWDLHHANLGTINGKMVCIDFGRVSQGKRWKSKVNPHNK
jgi:hypothetical protein